MIATISTIVTTSTIAPIATISRTARIARIARIAKIVTIATVATIAPIVTIATVVTITMISMTGYKDGWINKRLDKPNKKMSESNYTNCIKCSHRKKYNTQSNNRYRAWCVYVMPLLL